MTAQVTGLPGAGLKPGSGTLGRVLSTTAEEVEGSS